MVMNRLMMLLVLLVYQAWNIERCPAYDEKAFPGMIQDCWVIGSCIESGVQDSGAIGCLMVISGDSIFLIRNVEDAFSLIQPQKIQSQVESPAKVKVICDELKCSDDDLQGFQLKLKNCVDGSGITNHGVESIQMELRQVGKTAGNRSEFVAVLHRLETYDAIHRLRNALKIGTSFNDQYSEANTKWLKDYLKVLESRAD